MGGLSTLVASLLVHPVNFAKSVGDDMRLINEKRAEEAAAKSRMVEPALTREEKELLEKHRRAYSGK